MPWLYGAIVLAYAWSTHFAVILNDVFLLRWQAEHLSLSNPETFYNGFFPIGYPILLRIASVDGNPVLTMVLIQIMLAPLFAAMLYRLTMRLAPNPSGWIALSLALFALPVIHAIPSATPDFFSAFAVLAGLLFLTRERKWDFLWAGLCIGIGCLLRSHVLVFAVALAGAIVIFRRRFSARDFFYFSIGALPPIALQGLIQVWSGHDFFENAQAFNIWKTIHGMDWSNPPALGHTSPFQVIAENPLLFFRSVGNWMKYYCFYFLPLIAVVVGGTTAMRRGVILPQSPIRMLATAALGYLVLSAAGGSVSAFTPIIPIAAICVAPWIDFVLLRASQRVRRGVNATLISLVCCGGIAGLLVLIVHTRTRVEDYAVTEQWIQNHSHLDRKHIFTDDYDFYFPGLHYRKPRTSGGWGEVGLSGYLAEYPHIDNRTPDAEYNDLRQDSIELAIYRTPPYDPQGYRNVRSDSTRFILLYRTAQHEIYRIAGAAER